VECQDDLGPPVVPRRYGGSAPTLDRLPTPLRPPLALYLCFLPFPPQERSILLSIESLGRTLRGAVAGGRRGALEKAAWTVAVRTEAVMRRHCWTSHQVCIPESGPPSLGGWGRAVGSGRGFWEPWALATCLSPQRSRRPRTRPVRGGSRRRILVRALDTVATCWEKLFALHATATTGS
jgi:hypothetical protein